MKGMDKIIDMRMRGQNPILVFVDTDDETGVLDRWLNDTDPASTNVWIEGKDNPRTLDLRPLVGLQVSITGRDADRVESVRQAVEVAGARRVVGAVVSGRGWQTKVTRFRDSAGADAWQG